MRVSRAVSLSVLLIVLILPALNAEEQKRALVCKKCDRKVKDEETKFSVVVPAGIEFSAFDDIGCAMAWKSGECAVRQDAFDNNATARDYATGEEVPVRKAFFVLESGVKTPGDYGVIAFMTRERADAFVAEHRKGKVVTYPELDAMRWK